jgi:hypothetical protein
MPDGIDLWLVKPVEMRTLVEAVEQLSGEG